jgi:hypothetical protein
VLSTAGSSVRLRTASALHGREGRPRQGRWELEWGGGHQSCTGGSHRRRTGDWTALAAPAIDGAGACARAGRRSCTVGCARRRSAATGLAAVVQGRSSRRPPGAVLLSCLCGVTGQPGADKARPQQPLLQKKGPLKGGCGLLAVCLGYIWAGGEQCGEPAGLHPTTPCLGVNTCAPWCVLVAVVAVQVLSAALFQCRMQGRALIR